LKNCKKVQKFSIYLSPICASCKKIRDDHGYWNRLEEYIEAQTGAVFSHGLCPECQRRFEEE